MVKIAALVTVRNSSTRLPGKAIKTVFASKKSIEIVIERAKKTAYQVIVCTSKDRSDNIFEKIAAENDVEIYRGDLLNKITRWYKCFGNFKLDAALLVDGDDLLYDYSIGIRAINRIIKTDLDLIKNPDDIVCGFFTYAISMKGIEKLYDIAGKYQDTDVVTVFIKKANLKTEEVSLEAWERNMDLRLTLDYPEDLEMFKKTFEKVQYLSSGKEIIEFYKLNPQVAAINYHRHKDFLENQMNFNKKIN